MFTKSKTNLVVLCETNILSLISQRWNNYYQIKTKRYSIQQYRYSTSDFGGAESGAELNAAQIRYREEHALGSKAIKKKGRIESVIAVSKYS